MRARVVLACLLATMLPLRATAETCVDPYQVAFVTFMIGDRKNIIVLSPRDDSAREGVIQFFWQVRPHLGSIELSCSMAPINDIGRHLVDAGVVFFVQAWKQTKTKQICEGQVIEIPKGYAVDFGWPPGTKVTPVAVSCSVLKITLR